MTTLRDRIARRLAATGKSKRKACLDGGLSAEVLYKLTDEPNSSPSLETVRKLAIGLMTTPEWLAYGAGLEEPGTEQSVQEGPERALSVPGSGERLRNGGRLHNPYIQVRATSLERYVSGALQAESIPQAQADEYASVVLELLLKHEVSFVVHHLGETPHSDPEFPGSSVAPQE